MVFAGKCSEEPLCQRNNVFLALPQRRQGDVHRVDAIVQILAETSFAHQLFQVHIGGADEPDIHRDGVGATHPHNTSVLNDPQQLRLQVQRNIANFIEEERSAVGLLKLAHMVRVRICESALDVAEQFALKQRFSNRTSIHRHHRLAAAQALSMYFARQHILAGAIFAGDENRGIGGCNFINGFPDGCHRLGRAPEHRFFASLRMTGFPPHRLPGLVPSGGQSGHQLLIVPRLHDEIERSALHSFYSQLDIGVCGEQHHLHLRYHLFDLTCPVQALIAGVDGRIEVHIQQHHVRPELLQRGHQCRR